MSNATVVRPALARPVTRPRRQGPGRRHYSITTRRAPDGHGHTGTTLCGHYEAIDQQRADYLHRGPRARIRISELLTCRSCATYLRNMGAAVLILPA